MKLDQAAFMVASYTTHPTRATPHNDEEEAINSMVTVVAQDNITDAYVKQRITGPQVSECSQLITAKAEKQNKAYN
jgi:hypothetical protein